MIVKKINPTLKSKFSSVSQPLPLLLISLSLLICLGDNEAVGLSHRYNAIDLPGEFRYYMNGVVERTLPGPYIYRLLMPNAVYYLQELLPGNLALEIDFVLKAFSIFLLQTGLLALLGLFYQPGRALTGVLLTMAILPWQLTTIAGPSLIESADLLNAALMAWMLYFIRQSRWQAVAAIALLAMLNRETPLILLPLLLHQGWREHKNSPGFIVAALIMPLTYLAVRLFLPPPPGEAAWWFTFLVIPHNIPYVGDAGLTFAALKSNLELWIFLTPLLLLGFYQFSRRPRFLQMLGYSALLFIGVHYLVGLIREWRLWIGLMVLLMPLVTAGLFAISDPRNDINDES